MELLEASWYTEIPLGNQLRYESLRHSCSVFAEMLQLVSGLVISSIS